MGQDPPANLETALLERAQRLADEHLQNARATAKQAREEAEERARLREQREVRDAEAMGGRVRRQRVAAAELRLVAELDRLRWTLIEEVIEATRARMVRLAQDEGAYIRVLRAWVASAARSIDRPELVAEMNATDLGRFEPNWPELARFAGDGKRITLSREPIECAGGVVVRTPDSTLRVDDTIEARIQRHQEELQEVVMDRLFGSPASVGVRLG